MYQNTTTTSPKPCYCVGPQFGQIFCPCQLSGLTRSQMLGTPPPSDKQPGFFDLPMPQRCTDPSHNFPMHLYIPPGKGYRHVCPSCGSVQEVANPGITCTARAE